MTFAGGTKRNVSKDAKEDASKEREGGGGGLETDDLGITVNDLKRVLTPPVLPLNERITPARWTNIAEPVRKAFEVMLENAEYESEKRKKLNNKTILLSRAMDTMAANTKFVVQEEGQNMVRESDKKWALIMERIKVIESENKTKNEELDARLDKIFKMHDRGILQAEARSKLALSKVEFEEKLQ